MALGEMYLRSRVWLGSGLDMSSLYYEVEREVYWHVMKDEHGDETYPYILELSLSGGLVESMFNVIEQCHYTLTLLVFENEIDKGLFENLENGIDERYWNIKKEDI